MVTKHNAPVRLMPRISTPDCRKLYRWAESDMAELCREMTLLPGLYEFQ